MNQPAGRVYADGRRTPKPREIDLSFYLEALDASSSRALRVLYDRHEVGSDKGIIANAQSARSDLQTLCGLGLALTKPGRNKEGKPAFIYLPTQLGLTVYVALANWEEEVIQTLPNIEDGEALSAGGAL